MDQRKKRSSKAKSQVVKQASLEVEVMNPRRKQRLLACRAWWQRLLWLLP